MIASRAAGVLVGVALLTAAWPGTASETVGGLDLRLPVLPYAALVLGSAGGLDRASMTASVDATPAHASKDAPRFDPGLPMRPSIDVNILPSSADPVLPPPPAAPVSITASDVLGAAIAARLSDAQSSLHPKLARREREALTAFYALGDFETMWVKDGAWTARARAVHDRLHAAGDDGLDPADYRVPTIGAPGRDATHGELADAELKLSALAAVYARDARGARIEPSRLSSLLTPKLELPGADEVLARLAAERDPGQALGAYNPSHEGYRALKRKLAEVRTGGPSRSRLEGDILANMERWRWLPIDMGRRHVWVNIPEFKLRLVEEGRSTYEARVIVGKPETQTPVFSDEMDHAVVNPSWYVPPSIFKNEFHSDPAYAAARGYDVVRGKNGAVSIRQPPGERNALGFIKFMFPNQHAVYLHDTPNRRLFGADKRAFSHGCVRLDQPFRFGQFVLGDQWTETRLKSLIGGGERSIRLPEKMPVHLTYFTAFVDEWGELRQAADLYAVNNKVRVALGLPSDGTTIAEVKRVRAAAVAVERSQRPVTTPRSPEPAPRPQARRKPAAPRPIHAAERAALPIAEPPFSWWMTR